MTKEMLPVSWKDQPAIEQVELERWEAEGGYIPPDEISEVYLLKDSMQSFGWRVTVNGEGRALTAG